LAGQTLRLDFTLRPEGVVAEETIVGEHNTPLIDTTRTVAGGSVTRAELERLPSFSRSPLDFVFLLGGVTEEPLSTLYSRILYVYETDVSVYAPDERVHTEILYVHVNCKRAIG
ncbi:MAG TPA: hypothetical protein VF297_28065, partial [Pyrinomonadaceae bacterium]